MVNRKLKSEGIFSAVFHWKRKKSEEPQVSYRDILENSPDGFFLGDSVGNITYANLKSVEITGFSKEELCRKNIADLFLSTGLIKKPLRYDLLDIGKSVTNERELVKKDGKIIHIEMNSCAIARGVYVAFLRDISPRIEAENEVRVSEARLARAELASKAGNWELHLETGTMVGSSGACKIYGVKEEMLDFNIIKQVPLPEYREMMDVALKNLIQFNKPYDIEFKIRTVDTGEIKDIHSIAIYNAESKTLFGIIQDISEQKKVEAELRKAKEMAEENDRLKTAFLHNLSHEIRTPMNSIIGFSFLLNESLEDKAKLQEYAGIISQRSNDLLEIINDILEIAKIETNQLTLNLKECSLQEVFKEIQFLAIEFRNRIKKYYIDFVFVDEVTSSKNIVITDEGKLKQILLNLITNAFKFTQEGKITVSCTLDTENWLCFSVADTGFGIPEDQYQLIFERFFKLQHDKAQLASGNGLGLSIVKGLLDIMNGTIQLESQVGKGSTFSFQIPILTPAENTTSGTSESREQSFDLSKKTVLIVEDDVYNAEYLKQLLILYEANILQAMTCKEALQKVEEHQIDLILMDIHLPDGNGYDITRRIKEKNPTMKVVAQTAFVSAEDKEKALAAGCIDFLRKPIHKDDLLSVLSQQLR